MKKSAQLIYVVRSNIAHSEKTPHGPDILKAERDGLISSVTADVIEDVFDVLFEKPSRRLAVYGSLAPGGANASQLAGLDGQWRDGKVEGVVEETSGLQEFRWIYTAPVVTVNVFWSSDVRTRLTALTVLRDVVTGASWCPLKVTENCAFATSITALEWLLATNLPSSSARRTQLGTGYQPDRQSVGYAVAFVPCRQSE